MQNTGIADDEVLIGGTGVSKGMARASIIFACICFPPSLIIVVPMLLYYHFARKRQSL
jgi:hypothetical protein